MRSRNTLELENLRRPRLRIRKTDKAVTAGSCFAQHIGKALASNGFHWFDAEPGPQPAAIRRAITEAKVFVFTMASVPMGCAWR